MSTYNPKNDNFVLQITYTNWCKSYIKDKWTLIYHTKVVTCRRWNEYSSNHKDATTFAELHFVYETAVQKPHLCQTPFPILQLDQGSIPTTIGHHIVFSVLF